MSDAAPRRISPPDHCDECGFSSDRVTPANAAETVRAFGRRYRPPLSRFLAGEDAGILRVRPDTGTWSALEYAAHMRDVIALWGSALHLALTEDRPAVPRPDPDLADRYAAERRYNDEEPAAVLDQLAANAERMAAKVETVGDGRWDRSIVLGDEEMTVLAIVRKVAHEGDHHLLDVGRSLRAARTPAR